LPVRSAVGARAAAALQPRISSWLDRRSRWLVRLLRDELRAGAAGTDHGVAHAAHDRGARPAPPGRLRRAMASGAGDQEVLDLERVVCRLTEIDAHGARGFTIGGSDFPLRGFVVRVGDAVR